MTEIQLNSVLHDQPMWTYENLCAAYVRRIENNLLDEYYLYVTD